MEESMRRLLIFAAAALIGLTVPAASRADGMPSCPCPPHAKAKVKTVHRVRHRVRVAHAPVIYGLPGAYDLHAAPPNPLDSAYQPAMLSYFTDTVITGYPPGSAAGHVVDDAGPQVGDVYYHRTGLPFARPALPPSGVDNFPFRIYSGDTVREYDGAIGEYVQLSQRDAAAAIRVAQDKPLPLFPAPPAAPR
jgi:hypothetical protein